MLADNQPAPLEEEAREAGAAGPPAPRSEPGMEQALSVSWVWVGEWRRGEQVGDD